MIKDLASGKYDIASNLIPVNERKWITTYPRNRAKFIRDLGIPTYEKMSKVMFYDVLMKLSHKIVKDYFDQTATKKLRSNIKSMKKT